MTSKKMAKRRKLINLAWERCSKRTPYLLDKLLTLGGVFTDLRILTIISMFNYETAKKLYPILEEEDLGTVNKELVSDIGNDVESINFGELEDEAKTEKEQLADNFDEMMDTEDNEETEVVK